MMGLAYQIAGSPAQATWYHQMAVLNANDSTEYIAGPLADALMLDPAFSPRDARRVSDAFDRRLQADPRSYHDLYRLGRMQQVTGSVRQGSASLETAEKILREEIRKNPKNTDALTALGLTLSRLGKFAEANALEHKALELAGDDVLTKYRAAEILSLQMYSAQTKKIDEKKKQEALGLLHDAASRDFNLVELANADFYNMHDLPEFRAAISVAKH
jgi:tetratricopeptide (TPR) repeat protein